MNKTTNKTLYQCCERQEGATGGATERLARFGIEKMLAIMDRYPTIWPQPHPGPESGEKGKP